MRVVSAKFAEDMNPGSIAMVLTSSRNLIETWILLLKQHGRSVVMSGFSLLGASFWDRGKVELQLLQQLL
jgi:hypothetical protein